MYKQSAEQYRYFLTWRNTVLGGYFAILGALAYSLTFKEVFSRFWLLRVAATSFGVTFFSLVFWLLERRNRRLYTLAQVAACQYEVLFGVVPQDYAPKSAAAACPGTFANLDQARRNENPFEPDRCSLWSLYGLLICRLWEFFTRGAEITHSAVIDFLFGGITLASFMLGAASTLRWGVRHVAGAWGSANSQTYLALAVVCVWALASLVSACVAHCAPSPKSQSPVDPAGIRGTKPLE